MIAALASAAADANSDDAVSLLLTWGPGGVLVVLILTGWLEPKRIRETLTHERDDWRQAFEREQSAHQLTREALAKSEERAAIAIDNARTTTALLEGLGHAAQSRHPQ